MRCDVISIFPEMFEGIMNYGITARAVKANVLQLQLWNPRNFTSDNRQTVDDRPYGGGPGMVMKPEPLCAAIIAAKRAVAGENLVIALSPQGKRISQQDIEQLRDGPRPIFLAGRYEGIDERVIDSAVDVEWSIGDFILTGGELAAMVIIDALARLLPGALGDEQSAIEESFTSGLLDCPHYTRPEIFNGCRVPEVLLSGNHQAIDHWRKGQQLLRTAKRRPDLLASYSLTQHEETVLNTLLQEGGEQQ